MSVPKRRFPEFVGMGEWEERELGKIAKNLDNQRIPITESSRTKGDIPYYGASGVVDFVKDYIFDEYLLCISEDGANLVARTYPIAFSISGKTWVNNHAHVLRFKHNYTQVVVENYLNSISLEDFLTGMAQPKLNKAMLDKIRIPLPNALTEQKKIADCLSSLDEVIGAESSQLDALKAHKQGLMQQLFPSDGESVPRVRFDGFEGEWEEKKLSELANKISQKNKATEVTRVLTNSASGGILDQRDYFDKDIANQNNLDGYYVVDKGDFVYNPRVSVSAPVGPISKNKIGRGVMSPLYTVFRFKSSSNSFYEQFFKTNSWHSYLKSISNSGARHDRMSIAIGDFMAMPLPMPSLPEQQKIAACLSSLDDLITAHAAYISTLKLQKKGLMQQLFPSTDEDAA